MHERIAEIKSFLAHNDTSLAVRRMLDIMLDSGNKNLLRNTISWSRKYRKQQADNNEQLPRAFYEEANELLQKLEMSQNSFTVTAQSLLLTEGISKTYSKGNFSLKPISFRVNSGDVLGVVGENGNGKTTLLRCISGQLSIDAGSLTYSQLNEPDYYDIKHHLAFIPQRIPRWYGYLKDNLHFSASLSGVTGAENELMVDFMLERLNLSQYAHLTWNQISSGYRTRFEIARILLQKPSLLILDEPLANLDIIAQQTILTDLRYLAKSVRHPMGIVLSSQQLHEVEKVADTVLFIKQGECLFKTGEEKTSQYVLEIETTADRDTIVSMFGEHLVEVQFNGGYYTITSTQLSSKDILQKLVSSDTPLSYFRDITHSTKRFF